MPQTAVADTDSRVSLRELAARHGLTAAGARPSLPAYIRQLWFYRHFIAAFASARVSSAFGKTRLGRLWQVLTPLTNAAVYFLIFGVILGTRDEVNNFVGYLCVGLFVYIYSQSTVQNGIQSITGNLGLIRALQFPRASLPIAVTMIQLQHMVASMGVLAFIVLITREPLTVDWLLIVPVLALQTVFNGGLALLTARIGAKLPDLKQVMPFVLRVWMYGSAVLYSAERFEHLSEKGYPWAEHLVEANPLLIYIELMRHALMDDVPPAAPLTYLWLMGVGWALVVGLAGFVYFWLGEKEYGRG